MNKRLFALILVLVCLASAALADGEPLSTNILPLCYQYPVEGANIIYADGPVAVYASQALDAKIVSTVNPYQHIHVDSIDRPAQMAYIFYYEADTQTNWHFEDDCLKGWVEVRFLTFLVDYEHRWVVTADQPGNRLNLRTRPAADSPSLGKYYAGTIVWQYGEPSQGYLKVKIGHVIGYMDIRFLLQGLYTPNAELPRLQVTSAEGAVIHKLPQEDSEIIKIAPNNAHVTALAVRDDDWVQIVYENETGFARSETMTPELSY